MRNYAMTPRGLGAGSGFCFVCGITVNCGTDFASFVPSRETGEAIVNLCESIGCNARLDYRVSEPRWIQIKIVGCETHIPNIEHLYKSISKDKSVDAEKIINAIKILEKIK